MLKASNETFYTIYCSGCDVCVAPYCEENFLFLSGVNKDIDKGFYLTGSRTYKRYLVFVKNLEKNKPLLKELV
jgi:hypothetical protein